MIMEKDNFPVQWRGTILEMVLVACLLLFISYSNKLGTYHPHTSSTPPSFLYVGE